jgi:hypothetical protein
MRLTAKVKLLTDPSQAAALLETIKRANQACDWVSEQAWKVRMMSAKSLRL